MGGLPEFKNHRLFTYKVAADRGSAPNPFGKICTLAICKPIIRRVAQPGDVVAGFGCGDDSNRLVYLMVVGEAICWECYITRCSNDQSFTAKVPQGERNPGDCIWKSATDEQAPLPSWSGHGEDDFERDVTNGQKVLIGRQYWYFGRGDRYNARLPNELEAIVPRGQGHRSNANAGFREKFREWFNTSLSNLNIENSGILGQPADGPGNPNESPRCGECQHREKESDAAGEEDISQP